jgi:ribosome-associated protein
MANERSSDLPVPLPGTDLRIAAAELDWRFCRSSGPGGQNVNSTDSRVELRFAPLTSAAFSAAQQLRLRQRLQGRLVDDCLVIRAGEHRSQWQNRLAAQRRLVALLQDALKPPPPPRRPTRPSRGARERRLAAKQRRSAIKANRQGRSQPGQG